MKRQNYKGPPTGILSELPHHFIAAKVLVPVPGQPAVAPKQEVMVESVNPPGSVVTVTQV